MVAQPQIFGVIPVDVAFADQLREIFVAGNDGGRHALGPQARVQGADDVVGFVFAAREMRHAEQLAELAATLELQLEVGGCRLAIGLVLRVDAVAERGFEALVEGDRDQAWLGALDQVTKKSREAEQRVHGVAVAVGHVRRHGVIRAEHVNRGVYQVNHGADCSDCRPPGAV